MKKALNAWSVPANVPFEAMFPALKKAGFDAVELNLDAVGAGAHALSTETTGAQLSHIRALSEEHGLPVHSVSSSLWGSAALGAKSAKYTARELLSVQLELAEGMGADGILIVPGGIGDDCSIAEAWDNALSALEKCRDLIESGSVRVGVENVWNNFFLSPFEMARFVDTLNIKNLGAYFDVGNTMIFSQPEYWIEVLKARIVKIHIKDFKKSGWNAGHFVNLLEGDVRWARVIEALKNTGYDGYLTAELSAMPLTPEYLYRITADAMGIIIGR